jgi:hypothetical protein
MQTYFKTNHFYLIIELFIKKAIISRDTIRYINKKTLFLLYFYKRATIKQQNSTLYKHILYFCSNKVFQQYLCNI